MRKLIVDEWLSLDGHVADKQGELGFFASHVREAFKDGDPQDFLQSIDTILLGRHTYEQFAALWPDRPIKNDALADKINTAPKIVFSQSLKDAPWGKWPKASIESGDAVAGVKKLKSSPGGNIVLWGSASLAQALIKANLVDEYRIHLCPVLTGGGKKFFPEDFNPQNLTLLETKQDDAGVLFLRYQSIV